jgi:bifunctional DNA-binding transcriptional regulator/antitoxin component of YhaV-PrlF toxin-antitoxin module
MTAIPVSKRWTITIPPEIRKGLGLESTQHPMMLMELREGGVFMHPATAMPVREIPLKQMQEWIASDEADAERFWKSATRKKTAKISVKRAASK